MSDLPHALGFDIGPRPGTFHSCGIRNRLDYIFVTRAWCRRPPEAGCSARGVGKRTTRPTACATFAETNGNQQASDHAAVFLDLTL